MSNQTELDGVYIGMAFRMAKLSKARRAQVGAMLVTGHGVILSGYNGTPRGTDNNCETQHENESGGESPKFTLVTKPEVIHAELNCIMKAAREGISVVDSTVYVTMMPCVPCAAMMLQAGVKRVVYRDVYRDDSGVKYLVANGVTVDQVKE
jgi:dCMP deaminase